MEKDLLQSIKLELSKSFKLLPYERISLHRILGIQKTENGMRILLNELNKDPLIRESAIATLKCFSHGDIEAPFTELLMKQITLEEKLDILQYFETCGTPEIIPVLIAYIDQNRDQPDQRDVVARCFEVLRLVGGESQQVMDYFQSVAFDSEMDLNIRSMAIVGLSAFREIGHYEELLKEKNDLVTCAVYQALSLLCAALARKSEEMKTEEDQIFTYLPDSEDKLILNIRVLLGKMTVHFDEYSDRAKIEFINAMLNSNHREFIIYTMKVLTSEKMEFVERVLHLLLGNIQKLRDPDKLFRNLISLSVDTDRQNETVVEVFTQYFHNLSENRKNNLLRDKIYNYMIVTLETFFESYRKEFMITDVMEKNYPENFQRVRRFIMGKFPGEIKKRLLHYLRNENRTAIQKLLSIMADRITRITEDEKADFDSLLEILYDGDEKSREIAATRIEDVNLEKRYLRNRIIRLCELIGQLRISNASTILVKIFNYVKKYHDADIFNATAHSLSMLNYSYMLGELELLLNSGDVAEQKKGVELLSYFTDQRSLNILLDYLKERADQDSELMIQILGILARRDIQNNMTAGQILKKIIENNKNQEIRKLSIICLGLCGNDLDINYLDRIFSLEDNSLPKEAVVQAIGHIMNLSENYNRRQVVKSLQEYLKDPGIRIRIYACSLLMQMGNKDALKSIRDMMIIKNKNIQREILSIVSAQKSLEFSYFLIFLLKEEYAISGDIIAALKMLPREELVEIDHFIVNIFKKYESPDFDIGESRGQAHKDEDYVSQKGVEHAGKTLLYIDVLNYSERVEEVNMPGMAMVFSRINELTLAEAQKNKGIISCIGEGKVLSYFPDPAMAAYSALGIINNLKYFNSTRAAEEKVYTLIYIISDKFKIINGELLFLPDQKFRIMSSSPLKNRIIIDNRSEELLREDFSCELLPENMFERNSLMMDFHELIDPVNFMTVAQEILGRLVREEQEREKMKLQLDEEIKKHKRQQSSPTAIAYMQALDDLGKIMKNDLNEINKYIQRRSTDREMINNVNRMLSDVYKRFLVESSKIIVE